MRTKESPWDAGMSSVIKWPTLADDQEKWTEFTRVFRCPPRGHTIQKSTCADRHFQALQRIGIDKQVKARTQPSIIFSHSQNIGPSEPCP